jgi:pimeloyl-ACP methyl ester carboxylesterase
MTALIVLPGLDGTGTLHSHFLAACKSFEAAIAFSYPTHQALGYDELETLVRAALPRARPFVLLGESFSGPIALSIAARPPRNLVGIVLSTTFATAPLPAMSPLAWLARFAPVRSAPFPLLSWGLLGDWATPELETSLRDALRAVSPAVLRFRAATALRTVASDLAGISVPALYLRATVDRLLPRSAGDHIRSLVPHCDVQDIDGPHLLLQAAPRECARVVSDFARGLG